MRRQLSSRDGIVQSRALQDLLNKGPDAVAVLAPLLSAERLIGRASRWLNLAGYSGIIGLELAALLAGLRRGMTDNFLLVAAPLFIAIKLSGSGTNGNQLTRNIADAAAGLNDKCAIGLLVDLWLFESDPSRLRLALMELLPSLRQSDTTLLSSAQHVRLCELLARKNEAPLQLVIMKALEQVGGEEAIPHVARLAESEPDGPEDSQLRDGAVECLAFLRDRVDAHHRASTLLRSAEMPERPSALLRPVTTGDDSTAVGLLRPIGAESDVQTISADR